jgi:hypothetical protein
MQKAKTMETTVAKVKTKKNLPNNSTGKSNKLPFIESEVDMGFFEEYNFNEKDGIVINNSCTRITYCSCNCNDCFLPGAWAR